MDCFDAANPSTPDSEGTTLPSPTGTVRTAATVVCRLDQAPTALDHAPADRPRPVDPRGPRRDGTRPLPEPPARRIPLRPPARMLRQHTLFGTAGGGEDAHVHPCPTWTGTAKGTFLERLRDLMLISRGLDYHVQFPGPGGTNAVEAALRLAREVTGRRTVGDRRVDAQGGRSACDELGEPAVAHRVTVVEGAHRPGRASHRSERLSPPATSPASSLRQADSAANPPGDSERAAGGLGGGRTVEAFLPRRTGAGEQRRGLHRPRAALAGARPPSLSPGSSS